MTHKDFPPGPTYASYLKIDDLLSLQQTLSRPESHDELQFIVVHQVFELWFKLALHEVDAIARLFREGKTRETTRLFKRVEAIAGTFLPALKVLETMVPSDFMKFRDLLMPASGFQSYQFRELEYAMGLRDPRYLKVFDNHPFGQSRLRSRLEEPSIWDLFVEHLGSRGLDMSDEEAQLRSIASLYGDEAKHDLMTLAEAMIEFDEMFQLYREHHLRMAERMIGTKAGTGAKTLEYSFGKQGPMGTQGVEYLRSTTGKKFFPVLWAARSRM